MDRTLNSNAAPTRRSTSDLSIHGRVDVDLRKTVEILRNSGVNVTVCNEEPQATDPIVVGKEKTTQSKGKQSTTQSKGKQSTTPNVLAKGNGKALTINPPSDGKENASTHDFPTNKRQKTMEKGKEKKKENGDSIEVINISKFAIGQQRRRERERLEGRIRPLPIRGLVPTKNAIAQRRRREIERNGINHQAPSKQTTVDLVSLSTTDLETLDFTAQPNIRPLPLHDIITTPNAIAQNCRREIERNEIIAQRHRRETERNEIIAQSRRREIERNGIIVQMRQREIERNEIIAWSHRREIERNEIIAQSCRREIERNEIDLQSSSKQTNVDLVSLSMTDTETPDLTEQPNIREITPLTTHGEQNNLQGPRFMLGRILSPHNIAGELLNMELIENETAQVQPAAPPNVCVMQEENTFISPADLTTIDLSTAMVYHRQTYLQLFLILHLGMVTLGR